MAAVSVQMASRSQSLNLTTPPPLPPKRRESPLLVDTTRPPPIPVAPRQTNTPTESNKSSNKIQRKKTKVASNFAERLPFYGTMAFDKNSQGTSEKAELRYFLEHSWSEVISDHFYLTKKTRLQQQALWEFLTTERNYILKLRIVVEVFQHVMKIIQSQGDLTDVNQHTLFANIKDVLLANELFWSRNLQDVINKARETKQPIKATELLASFTQFQILFKQYIEFSLYQDGALHYLRSLTDVNVAKRNEIQKNFNEYLEWCENLPQCNRLKLRDLLTEPMQRLTRYPLLLKKIREESEDAKEIEILDNFISQSEMFISDINCKLRKRYEKEKLDRCLQQFDYYNNMKAANEKIKWSSVEFLQQNITTLPFEEQRCFLKRGTMKILEKKGKKELNVEVLLFTDVVVVAKMKKSTNKLQVIKQLFYLDKVKLMKSEVQNQTIVFIYLDECGLLATAFLFECTERDVWINAIERAKIRYQNAKAGQGSTLDFFKDDYNVNNIPDLKILTLLKTNVKYESDLQVDTNNENRSKKLKNTRSVSTPPESYTTKQIESSRSMSWTGTNHEALLLEKNCLKNESFSKIFQGDDKNKNNEKNQHVEIETENLPLQKSRKKNEGVSPRRSDSGISVRTFNSVQEDREYAQENNNNDLAREDHNYESISIYQQNNKVQPSKAGSELNINAGSEYRTRSDDFDKSTLFHMSNKQRSVSLKAPLTSDSIFYTRSSNAKTNESLTQKHTRVFPKDDNQFFHKYDTQSIYDDVKTEESYLDNG